MFKSDGILSWIALVVVLTFGPLIGFGQVQTGEILGNVTDSTGASVPAATVTVTNADTGVARQVKTDGQGQYAMADLSIGNYQAKVEMQGFSVQTITGLVLTVGQELVANFKLQVGTVAQQVTVNTTANAQVNTTTSDVGALVGERQLQELPLNGRNYMQLVTLTPGVQPLEAASGGPNSGNTQRLSVAGSRIESGSILLDGMEIRNFWGDGAGLAIMNTSLGVESIAEFNTMTNSFNAQYNGESVINEVTRSGTNQIHGSAYGYFRNSAMDARSYFDPASGPPAFHRYQFGGSVGGPIKKNKAFFFANYEGIRDSLAVDDVEDVPDANAHLGMLPCKALSGVAACTGASPSTLVNVGVNPIVAPYLALYPNYGVAGGPALPPGYTDLGNGTAQFINYAQQPQTENYFANKFDYNLSDKNNISFRWVVDKGTQTDPWPNGGNIAAPGEVISTPNIESDPETNWYATLQDRHIFSNSLINVGSFGYVRTNQGVRLDFSNVPGLLKTFVPNLNLLGEVTIGSMAGLGSAYYDPLDWLVNNYTGQDEVDWVHGANSFKFGGAVTRIQCNCSQNLTPGGAYSFGGIQGFFQNNPILLTGAAPATSAYPFPSYAQRYGRQTNLSAFVQDDWRILKRLTLNLGLRYDFITNPTEAAGTLFRITNLDPYTCSNNPACDGGTPEAGVSTGFTHEPHYFLNNPSTKNIDPRVGLAWDIFGDGSTSFRGGFGIFHNIIYPRAYEPGGAFGYPEVTASISSQSFGGAEGTFPNALLVAGVAQQARNQTPWVQCCTPYIEEWNATLERQLPWKMLVSLGYVGSAGVHLTSEENENAAIPVAGTQFRPLSPAAGAAEKCAPGCTQGYGVGGAGYVPNVAFGPLEYGVPHINSHYNSMILIVRRNLGNGIQFLSGFTYSRCLDFGSETVSGFDGSNDSQEWMEPNPSPSLNHGLCAFNISKNWTSNGLIPLPFHGNQLKEGWQLALISSLRTGQPVTPSINFDQQNLNEYTYLTERPSVNPSFTGPLLTKKQTQWFNPAAYELESPGTLGNAPRGSITGPGLFDMDFTVMKSTKLPKLREGSTLELRGDFFNVTNHVNFSLPSAGVFQGSPGNGVQAPLAGYISSIVGTARQLQFSARAVF
jgi:hypothetical protein